MRNWWSIVLLFFCMQFFLAAFRIFSLTLAFISLTVISFVFSYSGFLAFKASFPPNLGSLGRVCIQIHFPPIFLSLLSFWHSNYTDFYTSWYPSSVQSSIHFSSIFFLSSDWVISVNPAVGSGILFYWHLQSIVELSQWIIHFIDCTFHLWNFHLVKTIYMYNFHFSVEIPCPFTYWDHVFL